MKTSDFYFCVDNTDPNNHGQFCLTSIEYWNENECLDDCLSEIECLDDSELPFGNTQEACWEYYNKKLTGAALTEVGKQALLDAGFVYSDKMHDFINNA